MMASRGRQYGWLIYVVLALAFYVLYKTLSAKPRPPAGMLMDMPGPGRKLPVLDTDKLSGRKRPDGGKVQSVLQTESDSLTAAQKVAAMDVLPGMQRVVHLDLKGAAPKVSYLEELFPLLKSLGATGLLIEWEDMFPYDGELESIGAEDCYSKDDVKKLLSLAKDNSLAVIPLVQTFGHMEFVLKGEKFKHLREHPQQPQVINPHKPGSLDLIKMMIDQQLKLQPEVQHIHIGADEVWDLGYSPESKEQISSLGQTKDTLFLNHIREVAGYIRNTQPYLQVLMWDDMFRNAKVTDIEKSKVNQLITPVVWKYTKNVDTVLGDDIWLKYGKLFRNVWLASAFKGATGSDQFLTDVSYHYGNHNGWLKIIARISSTMNIKGTMLTGWQRYDHFGTLCELLPIAVPSLAVCLSTLQHAGLSKTDLNGINGLLGCRPDAPIQWSINKKDYPPPRCSYPGHKLLEGAYELKNALHHLNFLNSKESLSGWHKEYNMNRGFTQRSRMVYLAEKCTAAQERLTLAETIMSEELPKYFREETVIEWLDTNIKPLKNELNEKLAKVQKALKADTWPRRPIHKHTPM